MCKVTASETRTNAATNDGPVGKDEPRRRVNRFKVQKATFNSEKKGGLAKNPKRKSQEDKEEARAKKEENKLAKGEVFYKTDEDGNKTRVTEMESRIDRTFRIVSWFAALVVVGIMCYVLAWALSFGLEKTGASKPLLTGISWLIWKITGTSYRIE